MDFFIDKNKIRELSDAIKLGYRMCQRERGEIPRCIAQSEAERMYTGALLNKWRREGLIEPVKTGDSRNNMLLFDAERLEVLYAATIKPIRK